MSSWRVLRAWRKRIPTGPMRERRACLTLSSLLQRCLIEITGMDSITLQPAAGAHGEFTGILLTRAWHESQGNARKQDSDSRLRAWDESCNCSDLRLSG